ncbi:CPXCG motif-containing cysteine-rich protein [Dyella soli]|uniref:CPXCG motif-containing cysteine-rich protein n=1 Tax=Dyella soli TaxID=522319 RepID=A0A4R0YW76_9GAMM|nr:CPXCG motif-containing cysteine-rich protein [Dyella soli]TCI11243.1 CPXCG motif-containing cysteine-rich protein [Dyella soli]
MPEPVLIHCPYCGEPIDILVDDSVDSQRYVEDCQVCCRPIEIAVTLDEDGVPHLSVATENDG